MIAHVCAYLAQLGEVPEDLSVVTPDLEQAVIALLERTSEPVGAER
jgi:hypothetical protein